jgi:transposase
VTLIASLSIEGVGVAMSVEGATDGVTFETYVEHFLVPTLKEGQVVVMDNLQIYKSKRAKGIIERVGAQILFLPPYSPDFSKVKSILRRLGARTREALMEATDQALDAVSVRDAVGWFSHCEYDVAHHLL